MIDDKERLFAAAPRKKDVVEVGGDPVEVLEMLGRDRIDFVEFAKENSNNIDRSYAFLASRCCPVLLGVGIEEIERRLDPVVLAEIGNKVIELSGAAEKKK